MAYGAPSGRIANKPGKSYQYRALCDSCGLKYWNYELKLRWDGLWCCPDDWEVRHPLDFYRTRNDTHKLPFIRSDTPYDPESTWTPTVVNVTYTAVGNETFAGDTTGTYIVNSLDSKFTAGSTSGKYRLARSTYPSRSDATIFLDTPHPLSVSAGASATITLPSTPTYAGTYAIVNGSGKEVVTGAVPSGSSTLTLSNWSHIIGNLTFSCYYGT